MADNENIIVNVDLDTSEIEAGFKELDISLAEVKDTVAKSADEIADGVRRIRDAVSLCASSIIEAMDNKYTAWLGEYNKTKTEEMVAGLGEKAYDTMVALLLEQVKVLGKADGKSKPLLLPSGSQSSQSNNTDSTNGLVSSGIMLPDMSTEEMVQGISNVITKLKESVVAWGAQTTAKLADAAADKSSTTTMLDYVKNLGTMLGQLAANTAGWIANAAAKAGSTAAEWAQIAATTAWTAICGTATAVTSAFGVAMNVLTSPITLVIAGVAALVAGIVLLIKNWDTVKDVAIRAWEGIKAAFSSAWSWFESKVLNPVVDGVKGGVNGVIGFINGLIAAAVKGINSLIGMLNKLRFTVPDWVPGLGGETLGFSLNTIKAPQIPYLAKGAVLPANKPFLAMVGDQKHGTNVEAPLATIQEAVAVVLDEQLSALMAGFHATVQEIRLLRETVGNIRVGDEVIYRAAERYREKRAVMHGTGW